MSVIHAEGLTKRYEGVLAVDAIDLRVERGEIYAFLGRNGAGKTTTIRMLLGMIRPSAGGVSLFGEGVGPGGRGPWRKVGHLVESAVAYPELTVRENLEVARRLCRVADRGATRQALDRLGIAAVADRRAGELSLGNLQRLALARAMLHEPELLVLDEPSNALDPSGVVEVRELLRSLARECGTTVFMSSHILGEVDRLATRIGIIHEGRLLEEVDSATLDRRRAPWLSVDARDRQGAAKALETAGYLVTFASPGAALVLEERRAVEAPDDVVRVLVAAGLPPTRLAVEQEGLEEYFMRSTGGLRAGAAS